MVNGRYGEFKVLVDGEVVAQSGTLGFLGVLPSVGSVLAAVRNRVKRS